MKTASIGRQPQFIERGISQQTPKLREPNQNLKLLVVKKTSNGRQPQNIEGGISQEQTG